MLFSDLKVSWELQCNVILHCNMSWTFTSRSTFICSAAQCFRLFVIVFVYCLLSFKEKHWHVHVFVWVIKKWLTALGVMLTQQILCDMLRDLVLFVQFKKREKHPYRSITVSKISLQLYQKWHSSMGVSHVKLYKWCQIAQSIWYTLSMNVLSKKIMMMNK